MVSDLRDASSCSYCSAFCFFISAALFLTATLAQSSVVPESTTECLSCSEDFFSSYQNLSTSGLKIVWASRRAAEALTLGSEAMGAVAWFALMPSVHAFAALSAERSASIIVKSAFSLVTIISVIDVTFQAGMVQLSDWVSKWPLFLSQERKRHADTMGPMQVLEIAYLVTNSRTIWLFAADELFLAFGWLATAYLVHEEWSGGAAHEPFSRGWAHLSVLGALLSLVGFGLNVARVLSWTTYARPAGWVIALVYAVVMPLWVVWLGAQLRRRSRTPTYPAVGSYLPHDEEAPTRQGVEESNRGTEMRSELPRPEMRLGAAAEAAGEILQPQSRRASPPKPSARTQLRELQELLEEGLVSTEEYKEGKSLLLARITGCLDLSVEGVRGL